MDNNLSSPIKTRKPLFSTATCPKCSSAVEYELPKPNLLSNNSPIKLMCYSCNNVFTYSGGMSKSNSSTSGSTPTTNRKNFKIGTDEKPLSNEYYDILNVSPQATPAEIKKSYYALAMKYHPDKCKTDDAEERFKKISEAYQVLSDPILRKKYNEFGPKGSAPEGGFMNPEEFFQAQFGGDRFIDIIGELAIAKHFKAAMVSAEEDEEDTAAGSPTSINTSPNGTSIGSSSSTTADETTKKKSLEKRIEEMELRKAEREERVSKLADNLVAKLKPYASSKEAECEFRRVIAEEVEELKVQNYGVPLLHSIGYIYSNKANEYLTKDDLLGVTSFYHKMKMKGHAINETFSTIKSAVDVHKTFVQLQEAEKRGDLVNEDVKQRMEAEAARKGIEALWQGSKLEVESVLKSVCDRVLGNKTIENTERKRRAEGLKIIGEIYRSVKPLE